MNALIKQNLDSLIKTNTSFDKSLEIVENILIGYIGAVPKSFTFQEKTETPKTFARKFVPLNPKDYVELTSYSHHPYYKM